MVRLRRRDKSCFRVGGGSRSLLGLPWKARVSEISEKETRRLGLGRDVLTCVDVFFSFLLFCLLPCDHTERGQKQRWDGRPLLFSPSPLVLYSAWVFFSFCGVFCADSSISFSLIPRADRTTQNSRCASTSSASCPRGRTVSSRLTSTRPNRGCWRVCTTATCTSGTMRTRPSSRPLRSPSCLVRCSLGGANYVLTLHNSPCWSLRCTQKLAGHGLGRHAGPCVQLQHAREDRHV